MIYFAYAMAWISTAVATIAAMYFTHSPWCLLVFYFPASIELRHGFKDGENECESEESEDEQSED